MGKHIWKKTWSNLKHLNTILFIVVCCWLLVARCWLGSKGKSTPQMVQILSFCLFGLFFRWFLRNVCLKICRHMFLRTSSSGDLVKDVLFSKCVLQKFVCIICFLTEYIFQNFVFKMWSSDFFLQNTFLNRFVLRTCLS